MMTESLTKSAGQAVGDNPNVKKPNGMTEFTEPERNAMRAYLQRAEVRLSAMDRVATAFISGAGLLVLFPIFFSQAIPGLAGTFTLSSGSLAQTILLFIPFSFSIGLPLYALYCLLRDLTLFYFVGHSPGFPADLINPRFVFSGIAFSPDESPKVRKAVTLHEYSSDLIQFVLPFGEAQAEYCDKVLARTREQIIPAERMTEALELQGIIQWQPGSNHLHVKTDPPEMRNSSDVLRFNAALGLAGFKERDLVAEVAKSEASLVRHAIGLRRLVLRYFKALLMFIVTALVTFLLIGLVKDFQHWSHLVLAVGYLVWAVATPLAVRLPVRRWIYETSDPRSQNVVGHDTQLVAFENIVLVACAVAGVSAALGLAVILLGY
jgi:hypothetical protein